LSLTQSIVTLLRRDFDAGRGLAQAQTMYDAARVLGEQVRRVGDLDRSALERDDYKFNVHLLLGGQVKGGNPELYLLKCARNRSLEFLRSQRTAVRLEEDQELHDFPVQWEVNPEQLLISSEMPEVLGMADRQASALDWRAPDGRPWTADYAEALLELGRIEDAVQVVDIWEADATRLNRAWSLAQVTRCRGLIAAATGDVAGGSFLLTSAVTQHDEVGDSFGRARSLLALGVLRRRARQKRTARDAIRSALEEFERLGAATWVEKARAELRSIGGRTRAEGLTAAERRVADLVAEGMTNREVAVALFLGERTVAGHLTRVYAKLGVRSRTELARRLH